MILPGSTIGILGGGQLGRMLILAGRTLGYKFHVFEPKGPCAAGMVADLEVNADYSDREALRKFAESVDVITLEFENIPADAIDFISSITPVHPGREVLNICQHRQREKDFLKASGFPCVPFEYADSAAGLEHALKVLGYPCVIKTAAFGYDGKGQVKLNQPSDAQDCDALWERLGNPSRVVVEEWIEHSGEFSVICARSVDGQMKTFPMAENEHRNHILHASIVPARLDPKLKEEGAALACELAEKLEVIGLIAVELFLDPSGKLLVNEMAPRPHNSGHYSMDACVTGQFEQLIRVVAGAPFGSTDLMKPCVMINLLGDLWQSGEPDWSSLLVDESVKLHLYDKGAARVGRKMGHFTVIADSVDDALRRAELHFERLSN